MSEKPIAELAHDVLHMTLHGPVPITTTARLATEVLRLSKFTPTNDEQETPDFQTFMVRELSAVVGPIADRLKGAVGALTAIVDAAEAGDLDGSQWAHGERVPVDCDCVICKARAFLKVTSGDTDEAEKLVARQLMEETEQIDCTCDAGFRR